MQSGAGRHHRCSLQLRSTTVTTQTWVGQSVPGKSVGFVTVLGPTALDPSFVLSQPVAVDGKCRPILFLCLRPGQYPSVHPPLSCRKGQLILSPHTRMPRHHLWPVVCSPNTCLFPENSYDGHYPLFCVRVGMAGRCPRWWFSVDVFGEGPNSQHTLSINAVTILLV